MTKDDIIKIEQYRRFLRPDWRRWLPGDRERGLTPEQIKAQRHDFMLRDRAFETPLARRLREERQMTTNGTGCSCGIDLSRSIPSW